MAAEDVRIGPYQIVAALGQGGMGEIYRARDERLQRDKAVLRRLSTIVARGGRVYLDFASSRQRFGTSAFITKHAWPGMFRMVHLPDLVAAVSDFPFEIQRLTNDRGNYYLYARDSYQRWMDQRAAVTERFGAELWRKFQLLHASVANVMSRPSYGVSAFQMVLVYCGGSDGAS